MHGFKSFADKTEMVFGDGVTVVVGPNGCGKSNCVDAIKWVLGEQSAKSLRGGHMLDVIFNGSSSRKSMGAAEVALHFENSQSLLKTDLDEVIVSRKLYRSGESEYMLNNKSCRLKDIREMFMDTGIGADTYSIIEQGKVELLLQTSKQDRRAIFEEAAGISKYKSRRKEAERKLDRTEQNMLRLTDVIDELEKRLRSIKYQAGKARNYQTYSSRLNELRLHQFLYEYRELQHEQENTQARLTEFQDELVGAMSEIQKTQTRLSTLDHEIDAAESQIRDIENELLQCTSQINSQQDRIEYGQNRCKELEELMAKGRQQLSDLREQCEQLQKDIKDDQDAIVATETLITEQQEQLETLQSTKQSETLELAELRAQLEDEKSGLIDIVRRTAQLHNEIKAFDVKRDSLKGQQDRLNDRSGQISSEIEQQLPLKAALEEKLSEVQALIQQSQQKLEDKRLQIQSLDKERGECVENLSAAKEQRSGLQSRKQVLSDMEAKLEGIDKGVKEILKNREEHSDKYYFISGIVAEIFQADVAYASIVDAALSDRAQHLIINESQEILSNQEIFQDLKSRVQLICQDLLPAYKNGYDFSQHPEVKAKLIDLVKYKPEMQSLAWYLLGKTILVDNIDDALSLSKRVPEGYRWVTMDGQVLEADGTMHLGPPTKQLGLVSRKSELRQIDLDLDDLQERIVQLENQHEQINGQTDHLEKNLQELRTIIYENNTEEIESRSRIEQIDEQLGRLKQEQPLIASELANLENQIEESMKHQSASQQNLDDLQENNDQKQERIDTLESSITEIAEKEQVLNEQITELKVELGRNQQKRFALHEKVKNIENQIYQYQHNIQTTQTDLDNAKANLEETERSILTAESKITELFQTRQDKETQAKELRGTRDTHYEEKEALVQTNQNLTKTKEALQEKIHNDQMHLNEVQLRTENLTQRSNEDIGLDLAEYYQKLVDASSQQAQLETTEEVESAGNDMATEESSQEAETTETPEKDSLENELPEMDMSFIDMDFDAVAEEIKTLREKISRLGNVNLDAISEQDELEERATYLNEQAQDLQDSKKQLEDLILKLNETSQVQFQQNFDLIRDNFAELYRKLFGGGRAEIILEDPENILECDIEIIARPPGKQLQSISLLSGGEKTMTAVALLLAIFKSKPSPFCVMDEADAALDEANNERFNLVIKEFLKDSQFIVITHSRRTMSIADVLYGVTMQEQGVSKKVSVRFADYDEVMEGSPPGSDSAVA